LLEGSSTEEATDKGDSAESSEATPEAAKADQTTQENADNSAESSEATPQAAKLIRRLKTMLTSV